MKRYGLLFICILFLISCTQSTATSPVMKKPDAPIKEYTPTPVVPAPQPPKQSTEPVFPDNSYKLHYGSPSSGTYPALPYALDWTDPKLASRVKGTASTAIAPQHYDHKFTMMYSYHLTYRDFGIKLVAGDYILPADYFCHNVPYTLWSVKEGWYVPALDSKDFAYLLYYLSKNAPYDVNYDKPTNSDYRWYQITEQDVQEWRIQELEDKLDRLEQQQGY